MSVYGRTSLRGEGGNQQKDYCRAQARDDEGFTKGIGNGAEDLNIRENYDATSL